MEVYFLQMPRKDGLSKKNRDGIWSFLYDLERWHFFSSENIFSLDEKWKMSFLKKYMEINMICSTYIYVNVTNMISTGKNTLKGDWYSRKNSNDSLYFYENLHRQYHILLCSEKKLRNLIYRVEIWKFLSVAPYVSGTIYHIIFICGTHLRNQSDRKICLSHSVSQESYIIYCNFWYTCVKWLYLQQIVSFFKILILGFFRG